MVLSFLWKTKSYIICEKMSILYLNMKIKVQEQEQGKYYYKIVLKNILQKLLYLPITLKKFQIRLNLRSDSRALIIVTFLAELTNIQTQCGISFHRQSWVTRGLVWDSLAVTTPKKISSQQIICTLKCLRPRNRNVNNPLNYLKLKKKASFSFIIITEENIKIKSELGEAIKKRISYGILP